MHVWRWEGRLSALNASNMITSTASPTTRFAVVGTSHVGCIQSALKNPHPSIERWRDAFFFAVNAPMLAKQNVLGWPEPQGSMSCNFEEGRNFLRRLFGDPNIRFIPSEYDVVLLVDFFYCYDFAYQLRDNKPGSRTISGTPVSDALYREVIMERVGRSWYGPNGPLGEIPRNSINPLLERMRRSAPNTKFLLAARPAQPSSNIAALRIQVDRQEIFSDMKIFEEAATNRLSKIGIEFVSRRTEQNCSATGLTPDHFSVGPHRTRESTLDEHTNEDYGRLVLEQAQILIDAQNK